MVIVKDDQYLLPLVVAPLKLITDAVKEQYPDVHLEHDFEFALDEKATVLLGSCKNPLGILKTFPELLKNKSPGRLVLFKAFQYRMGSHLESLRVVESNEIP